jgi:hypothetical protein
MNLCEVEKGFRATIDKYFKQQYYGNEKHRQAYIAGILQTALHIIPLDNYYALKNYIYQTWGYDPGGAANQQITIDELEAQYNRRAVRMNDNLDEGDR